MNRHRTTRRCATAIAVAAWMPLLVSCAASNTPVAGEARTPTPVERHGRLEVSGNRIVGSDGDPVSLAGVSMGWSNWEWARFYNTDAVTTLAGDWRAGIVRAALGVHPTGYLTKPEENEARVVAVVDAAIASGIYVIIDWHDHHAHEHPELAVAFFERMARTYGDRPNVIYEIYNEPLRNVSWPDAVKPYSERVIAAIRAIDPDNLILVGSPSWSQDVDAAAADPIRDPNVAYALHFYAGTHKQSLRDKATTALDRGFALFVSEWGVCDSNGDGPIDRESIDEWLAFMREHKISHCAWSLGDKRETASMLEPGAPSNGGWTSEHLTDSGELVRDIVRGWNK
jgi:endoglucanase